MARPERGTNGAGDPGPEQGQQAPPHEAATRSEPSGPRLVAGDRGRRRSSLWLILIAALLLIVVIAVVWYELSHHEPPRPLPAPSPSPSSFAWVGAWARTDGPGGGLVVAGAGPAYNVTLYDAAVRPVGSVTATATADGTALRLALPAQFSLAGPYGALTATITAQPPDGATMTAAGADGGSVTIGLKRVPKLAAAVQPSSSPPTPAGTPEATSSPTPAASASSATEQTLRHQMIAAIGTLQAGIEAWAADNHEMYPPPSEVRREGAVAAYVNPWPSNPWSPGQPLTSGLEPGGYVYDQLDGGLNYRLTGVLDKGTFVVP